MVQIELRGCRWQFHRRFTNNPDHAEKTRILPRFCNKCAILLKCAFTPTRTVLFIFKTLSGSPYFRNRWIVTRPVNAWSKSFCTPEWLFKHSESNHQIITKPVALHEIRVKKLTHIFGWDSTLVLCNSEGTMAKNFQLLRSCDFDAQENATLPSANAWYFDTTIRTYRGPRLPILLIEGESVSFKRSSDGIVVCKLQSHANRPFSR